MLWVLLSNRWLQGGMVFFVLIVGGSLLYSWHLEHTNAREMARHNRFLQRLETHSEKGPVESITVPNATNTAAHVETPTTTKLPSDSPVLNPIDVFEADDMATEAALAEEVPVSPYGFGPYPKLPPEWEGAFPPVSIKHELMVRVAVKLREQGVNVKGASMEDGFVFPNIKGIYYVKWKVNGEGLRYISEGTGHPEDGNRLHTIRMEKGEPLTESDIPSDIQLVSYEEGRIDPYDFLGFQR